MMSVPMRTLVCALLMAQFSDHAMAQAKPEAAPAAPPAAAKSAAAEKAKTGTEAAQDPAKAATAAAAARTQPSAGSVATGWTVNCATPQAAGKLLCEVSNTVVITPANQRFVSIAVRHELTGTGKLIVLTLPHGVLFTSGMIAQVDAKEIGRFEALTSDQQGAYAKMAMTPEATAALEKGETLTIIFDGANGQKFTIGMALSGFAAAHAKMSAEK